MSEMIESVGFTLELEEKEFLLEQNGDFNVNLAFVLSMQDKEARREIRKLIESLLKINPNILFQRGYQRINSRFGAQVADKRLDYSAIAKLRERLAFLTVQVRDSASKLLPRDPSPNFDAKCHNSYLRYGIVELRVLENWLFYPEQVAHSLGNIVNGRLDQEAMYAPGNTSSFLSADDIEWSIRRLMTNAGFYVGDDPDLANADLSRWCDKYLAALLGSKNLIVPTAYPFAFAIQKHLYLNLNAHLDYMQHPGPFDIYRMMDSQDVLFLTPFASEVNHQYRSGNLWRLYRDRKVPRFNLRVLPAFVTTWPNKAHGSFGETFDLMCRAIDNEWARKPYDVFIASCGCYGLPLCEYVRITYGVKVIYIGNVIHAYFGVLQNATENFMLKERDNTKWIRGDLRKYANVALIDNGRYV